MKDFFDSSVLISAFDDQDENHDQAWDLFKEKAETSAIAMHSMAETFSVLTGRRGWRASQAFEIVKTNTTPIEKVALSATEFLDVLEGTERLGVRGGAVYDALILACARKAKASTIWTFNARHFVLFSDDLRNRIKEP